MASKRTLVRLDLTDEQLSALVMAVKEASLPCPIFGPRRIGPVLAPVLRTLTAVENEAEQSQ